MPVEVILPKVDMDMATGKISRWFVGEGAVVRKGDVLFEIETDKAAMEIDSPADGTIRDIVGKEGIDIPVGEAVAWIYAEGEKPSPSASPLQEGREAGRREGEAVGGGGPKIATPASANSKAPCARSPSSHASKSASSKNGETRSISTKSPFNGA